MTVGRTAPFDPPTCAMGLSPEALLQDVDGHEEGVVGYVLSGLKRIPEIADGVENRPQFADAFKQHLYRLQWVLHEHPMLMGQDLESASRMRSDYDRALPDMIEWVDALASGQTYAVAQVRRAATQLYATARPVLMSLRS